MDNRLKVIGSFFIVILLLQTCSESEAADQDTPQVSYKTVATQKVKTINYQPLITASGRIAMDESINLSFKAGGQIIQIYVKNGQMVKKGQILAKLNTNQVEIQADQANINIDRVDIAIKSSELLLEKAKTDYENTLGLFEDSLATLEQLEQAKVNMDIYKNQLLTTQKEQQLSAKKEKSVQMALEDAQILAPTDGMVLQKLVSNNEMVSSGMPVFLFTPKQQARILKVHLTDKEVVQVNVGDSASVYFDAHPDKAFKGQVLEIAYITDPVYNTYELKVGLQPTSEKLLFGFIGTAKIKVGTSQSVNSIPVNALVSADGKKGKVFTVNNAKAVETLVTIYKMEDDQLLVSEGLVENQEVVISGIDNIRNADHVVINNTN